MTVGSSRRAWVALAAVLVALCCAAFVPQVASAAGTGSIGGHVKTAGTSADIANSEVCAYEIVGGREFGCTLTDVNGDYVVEGLGAGEYEVVFAGTVCSAGNCTPTYGEKLWQEVLPGSDPTPVIVVEGDRTPGINATLEPFGRLEGTIQSSLGGRIEHALVCVEARTQFRIECGLTDSMGEYEMKTLPPGEYIVEFPGLVCSTGSLSACNSEGQCLEARTCTRPYVPQYYNGKPRRIIGELTKVAVHSSLPTIVGATLKPGGTIKGRATVAAVGAPAAAGVIACTVPHSAPLKGECATANANGEYAIEGLESGQWEIEYGEVCVTGAGGSSTCSEPFGRQYYSGKPISAEPDLVSLTAPGTVTADDVLTLVNPVAPGFTAAPGLSGSPAAGATLTCSGGSWSNYPTAVTYSWRRDGVAIAGQAAATFVVTRADEGTSISCAVAISNAAGSASAVSDKIDVARTFIPSTQPLPIPSKIRAGGAVAPAKATAKNGKVSIPLTCTADSTCKGRLTLAYEEKAKGKPKKIALGAASFSIAPGKTRPVTVKLSGKGRSLLAAAGKKGLKLTLAGTGVRSRTLTVKPAAPSN
jgi:hypothetical protein